MKKKLLFIALFGLINGFVYGQSLSKFSVKYMVSYDADKQLYTAWVVPDYETPNYHNADTEEKGATAQFTLKVPKGFVVSQIHDIRGTWEKAPIKLGTEEVFRKEGINAEYYVIGKAPSETNYGVFQKGEPVALFSFKGNVLNSAEVKAIESNDPFIRVADRVMALNVGSSFYSRSGQKPLLTAQPLEQFASPVNLTSVLADLAKKVGNQAENMNSEGDLNFQVLAYPNPAADLLTLKYFLDRDDLLTQVALVDVSGEVRHNLDWKTKRGINTLSMSVSKMKSGSYVLRLSNQHEIVTKKVSILK
ncbi:T9SS type A sorting domain-containing protein [Runella zeae]|uniref:T9SS type A sorting domain-containing protein n=1 Tax=Runella zeae TaxID=94255 RepID=UPI0004904723|nr:T9SS type A sorting domain-containing protein [Runella zeae]